MASGTVRRLAVGGAIGTAIGIFIAKKGNRSLAGKVVLLTGGSRGLGLALARRLAREKAKLILVARDEKEIDAAVDELAGHGATVHGLGCDLTDPIELRKTVEAARNLHGRIDIVINDAGRIDVGPLDAMTEDDFRASMDLMFWAPLRITLQLLPDFLRSGDADIVNISSLGGRVAVPHLLSYSAAKFALCGLSEGLSAELAGRGVHVLTVTPGLLRTGSHRKASFSGKQDKEYDWFALGATVPGLSMEVDRAAGKIVSALKARKRALLLGWSAQILTRIHGLCPNSAIGLMGLMNTILPEPSKDRSKAVGSDLQAGKSRFFRAATSAGERAAERQNEDLS